MKKFRPFHSYPIGAKIQRRDGSFDIKTEEGLVKRSRFVASSSDKVVGGGVELQKGWRVCHIDMSTHGQDDHDRPENLVVIRCRTYKFKFLDKPIVYLPKNVPAPSGIKSPKFKIVSAA